VVVVLLAAGGVGGGVVGGLWGVVKVAAAEGTVAGRWAHGALTISFFVL
jgi:hypothetical protein